MTEYVTVGTAVIAYIEPHEGRARAFNAWYERDHFYAAAMAGPGCYAGARWVATRDCKESRTEGWLFGDNAVGSYLATYWILPGKQEEWDEWIAREYGSMPPERLFAARDHLHTAVYDFAWDSRADGAPIPATALDHGFAGVVVTGWTDGGAAREWAEWIIDAEVPLVMAFSPQRTIMSAANPPPHKLVLAFTRMDPRLTPLPLDAEYGSAFLATIPGTDTYVDEL
ncbi:MAG TPA: hypothetical protein VFX21_13460 [Acidimicrobiia bacterium]|nr:hypothetical protein [Acidimicrobiia bacterium]